MKVVVLLLLVAALASAAPRHHFAVLVAGSKDFWNYRHQADVCHAYHIAVRSGIPEENIIVMAYDDIADNPNNPFPGQIFNKKDGPNVYEGCQIDYRGKEVNPQNFLNVLQGNATGRNIETDENSKIFLYFSDHGSPGLIAFPEEELHADELDTTIRDLHAKNAYGKILIYIEACESGSMFDKILTDDLNVFATTAANPTQPSFGAYCRPFDTVNGTSIGSCLSNEFSANWLQDTDRALDEEITCDYLVKEQVNYVKNKTQGSQVCEYGDLSIKEDILGSFQGTCYKPSALQFLKKSLKVHTTVKEEVNGLVNSRLIKLEYLYNKYMRTQSVEDAKLLQDEITKRVEIEERFNVIKSRTNAKFEQYPEVKEPGCYKEMIKAYKAKCGMDEYDLEFFNHFVSMCNSGVEVQHLIDLVTESC